MSDDLDGRTQSESQSNGESPTDSEVPSFEQHVMDYCHSLRALHEYVGRIPDIKVVAEKELLERHHSIFAINGCCPPVIDREGPSLEQLFFETLAAGEDGNLSLPAPELDKNGRQWMRACGSEEFVPFEAYVEGLRKVLSGFGATRRQMEFAVRSVVTTLVSVSESFLSAVLEDFFRAQPDALMKRNPAICFANLRGMRSVDDATAFLVSQHVKDEMFKGTLQDLHERLKAQPLKLCETDVMRHHVNGLMPAVREVFERRHLYTHSDGVVDEKYLSQVPESLRGKIAAGARLHSSLSYLRFAIDACEIVFLLLGVELWRKAAKKDEARPALLTQEVVYELLLDSRWHVAEAVTAHMVEDKACDLSIDEISRINHALCLKRLGRWDEVEATIRDMAPSESPSRVALARLGLLEDGRRFFPMLRQLTATGDLLYVHANEWPVLEEMRQRPAYRRYQQDMVPSPEEVLAALQETYDEGHQPTVE